MTLSPSKGERRGERTGQRGKVEVGATCTLPFSALRTPSSLPFCLRGRRVQSCNAPA